jgi:hypothetical protein
MTGSQTFILLRSICLLSVTLSLLTCIFSCNNSPKQNGSQAAAAPAPIPPITIQNLYMDRTQFNKLETALGHTPEFRKLVFEFTFPTNPVSGPPTLSVKEAKANNKEFGTDSVTLQSATGAVGPQPKVYFSTLQFNADPIRDAFRRHTSPNSVILFVAQSDPHLHYHVYVVDDYTTIKDKMLDSAALSGFEFLGNANPSPPHPSN